VSAHRGTVIVILLAAAVAVAGVIYLLLPNEQLETAEVRTELSEEAEKGELAAGDDSIRGADSSEPETEWKMVSADSGRTADTSDPETGSSRAREDYLNAQFRPMAKLGVQAALAQVRQLPDTESRDMAMLALLGEWSGLSVTEMAKRGDIGRFGVAGALGLHLMNEGKMTPQETAALANEFLSDGQRVGVLARAAEKLAATDPASALAMGEGLADWQQTRFLSRFVSGWASSSPEAARSWAAQVPDQRTRSVLMGRVLAEEVKVNPASAALTFAQAPPEDLQVRQRTARQIGAGWAGQDTLSAMQWADNLPSEDDRRAAYQGIRSTAPVGIGARLSRGDDGLPVLQDLVPGSPASNSGQLRSGDRIVAVADPNGTWVNSRAMPLGDVVRMIKGEPQSQVSLQVQSADGSPPRVVTLGREQIIHRPGS
jgi:hypothetical protein